MSGMYKILGVVWDRELDFMTTVNIEMEDVPSSENCSNGFDGDALQYVTSMLKLFSGHIMYNNSLLAIITNGVVKRVEEL